LENLLGIALGSNNNFVINRHLAEEFGCKDTALLLQFLIIRQGNKEEFHCDAKEIQQECLIGECKRRSIFKRLKQEKILEISRHGAPAKNYYSVKIKFLETRFLVSRDQVYETHEAPTTTKGEIKSGGKIKFLETRNHVSDYIYINNTYTKTDPLTKSSLSNESNLEEFSKENPVPIKKGSTTLRESELNLAQNAPNLAVKPQTYAKVKGESQRAGKRANKEEKEKIKNSVQLIALKVIEYLNARTNKKFRAQSTETIREIGKRFKENYNFEDFKQVIDNQVREWGGDPIMAKYLRPSTLFGPKFEGYLNSTPVKRVDPLKEAFLKQI